MAQERRVLLANGQYITIVQTTGTSSGDVMSQSAVTAALSTKANISHTHNASAITGGTFGTARIADGAITTVKLQNKSVTLEKLADNVPISTTSYEIVKVSGLTLFGAAAVGADVLIGGAVYKIDSTGVVSAPIPYGQVYKIQAYPNDTWMGNYEATFTANTPSRSISITYIAPNGVFIEATDGTLYTSSNWNSGKAANSIIVSSDSAKFRIALAKSPSYISINSSMARPYDRYMEEITGGTSAKADYDGAGNTAKMLLVEPSTSYAAGYCNAFTFPDGKTKGFLPSLGQLWLAYQNKAAVDAALTACGGTAFGTNKYWSSTYHSMWETGDYRRNFWQIYWYNGNVDYIYASNDNHVRPFAAYQ